MPGEPVRKKLGATLAAMLLFLVAALAVGVVGPRRILRSLVETVISRDYAKFRAVKTGWTEEEVRRRLGPPYRAYDRATAPKDYYVRGWARKERAITHRVLIYIGDEPIAYIYIDRENRVEETYIVGS